ncbi:hypothetical protein C8Q76DRAFT_158089 [Earliella scabrosa]|nr:hypothetical protein C8Q76DRAFT_158089 [Earliella scabrosa]
MNPRARERNRAPQAVRMASDRRLSHGDAPSSTSMRSQLNPSTFCASQASADIASRLGPAHLETVYDALELSLVQLEHTAPPAQELVSPGASDIACRPDDDIAPVECHSSAETNGLDNPPADVGASGLGRTHAGRIRERTLVRSVALRPNAYGANPGADREQDLRGPPRRAEHEDDGCAPSSSPSRRRASDPPYSEGGRCRSRVVLPLSAGYVRSSTRSWPTRWQGRTGREVEFERTSKGVSRQGKREGRAEGSKCARLSAGRYLLRGE